MDKILKPLGFLLLIIFLCSMIVRIFSGSETLIDYANENPEIGYATPTKKPLSTASPLLEDIDSDTDSLKATGRQSPTTPPYGTDSDTSNKLDAKNATGVPENNDIVKVSSNQSSGEILENRNTYQTDFYSEALSDNLIALITGTSFPIPEDEVETTLVPAVNIVSDVSTLAISYDDLRYISVLHYDFNGQIQTGELICNKEIAQDILEIFYELYQNEYQIEKICLIEEYGGDDTLSMIDNNTSCFNYRVVDGTSSLSKHALGLALDINPFYNPYVVFNKNGSTYISPEGSEIYTDRSKSFPYKIDENDLCYKLFIKHGFIWGGNWNSLKDYQHFQKNL